MKPGVTRAAQALVLVAAALIIWVAVVRRSPAPAPRSLKPAELPDSASRAVSLWWRRPDTLDAGETLNRVLRRGGVDDATARDIVSAAAPVQDPRRMVAGMTVQFLGDSTAPAPREIVLRLAIDRRVHIVRDTAGAWHASEERLAWTTDTVVIRGAVRTNLYDAFSRTAAGLFPGDAHNDLVFHLANVYEYRVDMTRALRTGDSLYAVVQRKRGPESAVRVDMILASRLFVRGKWIEAFVFPDATGHARYFDALGQSLATMFLRTPIEFARISSHFNPRRYHPILQIWRAHRGTDYAAASGTAVRSIGDGRVVRAGFSSGGYGNVVDIDHGSLVSRYGHLSAFGPGIHAGASVAQGQTIGRVGMTGLATAPHLHFEILKGGVQVNSETALENIAGKPLPAPERAGFNITRDRLVALLGRAEGVARDTTPARPQKAR